MKYTVIYTTAQIADTRDGVAGSTTRKRIKNALHAPQQKI
jgi:hypothetical protein